MPAIDEQSDERHADDGYGEVALQEVDNKGNVVGVASEMDLFEGKTFHRMCEIHHIRSVEDNHHGVGNQEDGIKDALVPSLFTDAEGKDGKQDEKAVGPKQRHDVIDERAFGNIPSFGKTADVAQISLVNHVKRDLQNEEAKIGNQKPKYQRCNIVLPKYSFGMISGFLFHYMGVAFEPAKLGFYGEKTLIKTTSQAIF